MQSTVVYPVMGHHGPGGSKTFPGVAVGEDEILGAGGDSHPDAVAFPEAIGQLGGADLQADDLAFLQKLRLSKAITVSGAEQAIHQEHVPNAMLS